MASGRASGAGSLGAGPLGAPVSEVGEPPGLSQHLTPFRLSDPGALGPKLESRTLRAPGATHWSVWDVKTPFGSACACVPAPLPQPLLEATEPAVEDVCTAVVFVMHFYTVYF